MQSISEIILRIVEEMQQKNPDSYRNNLVGSIRRALEIDHRGDIGEEMVAYILDRHGYNIEYERGKTAEDKGWDVKSNGIKLEVKFATTTNNTFQYEDLYPDRDYDAVIFIGIMRDTIYMIAAMKKDFAWDELHLRKDSDTRHKCDITLAMLKNNKIKRFQRHKAGIICTDNDFLEIYHYIEGNI